MTMPEQVPTVSVAILSHRRPHLLARVLTAVAQLDYPEFEIVVVGDQTDLAAYDLQDWLARQVRYVHFGEPNICCARNLAVQASAGEIVAFIDDDAAPEPDWLRELVRPFQDPRVATVGGTVRASDGVSIEWQGGVFDRAGQETMLSLTEDITIRTAEAQHSDGAYLSLRGVNSAFRRSALIQVGGFDEAIRYYLDETDMALRLADAGWSAAIARHAEVHHLLVPNASRGLRRMPGNQHEIGAGKAVFCKKYSFGNFDKAMQAFRRQRLAMLDPQMRLGIVRMVDRLRVEAELEAGIQDGATRVSCHPLSAADGSTAFRPFQPQAAGSVLNIALETGWSRSRNRAVQQFAKKLAATGHRVSLFSFQSGPKPLSVGFQDGVWYHRGGTWTLPARNTAKVAIGRAARSRSERGRVALRRSFDVTIGMPAALWSSRSIILPRCRRNFSVAFRDGFNGDRKAVWAVLQSVAQASKADQQRSLPGNENGRRPAQTPMAVLT